MQDNSQNGRGRQRRGGDTRPRPQPPPAARPAAGGSEKQVIRIHSWAGGRSERRTYVFAEGRFRLKANVEEPSIKEVGASAGGEVFADRVNGVYRVVFFQLDRNQSKPLLVLDLHHPSSSLELLQSRTVLRIDGRLVSALTASQRLRFRSVLSAAMVGGALQPAHDEFSLGVGDSRGPNLLPAGGASDDRLRLLVETEESRIRPFTHSDGLDPTILEEATNLNMPQFGQPDCGNRGNTKHQTRISFPIFNEAVDPSAKSKDFHILMLTLRVPDLTGCSQQEREGEFRTFWKKDELDFDRDELSREWLFVQRPAGGISAGAVAALAPGEPPPAHWMLHVFGVPTRVAVRSWNRLVPTYHDAIEGARGGQPVSFLPSFPSFDDVPDALKEEKRGWWAMTYSLLDRGTAPRHDRVPMEFDDERGELEMAGRIVIRPLSLHFWRPKVQSPTLEGELRQIKTFDDKPLAGCTLTLTNSIPETELRQLVELELRQGVVLKCAGPVTFDPVKRQAVRMGSLDLEFGANEVALEAGSENWFLVRREGRVRGVHIDAHFHVSDLWPGGQDAPADEEFVPQRQANWAPAGTPSAPQGADSVEQCIEGRFRLKQPVIIYQRLPEKAKRFLLRVQEDVRSDASQAVRLDILSQNQNLTDSATNICSPSGGRDVIVLDRNPFLVAQVRYVPFDRVRYASNTIARWSNAEGVGPSWQLQFDERPFCLVLPPQAVGEAMAKAREIEEPKPDKPSNLNFNFGPAAKLELDPRAARTRFSEAPWNLRRILGTQGQPGAGPGVLRMQYELLYGLSCVAEKPAIRLADIFSRVGRIPARRDSLPKWKMTDSQSRAYLEERIRWSKLYRRYAARVALLEPWNSLLPADPRSSTDDSGNTVVLSERLKCVLRLPPQSNMKAPFDPAPGSPPAPAGTLGGGATWGFESRNVYNAVVSPENINSSSAQLSAFSLSALGGWGKQKAGFQKDLTTIYGDVAMGRAYRYKLERIGRIACFWNLAKHVIVYERTVVPSQQFGQLQTGLRGWPVLRKVREYVEILEDERGFPDGDDPREEGDKRACGFVRNCQFQQGAQFNVLSSWGSDVRDEGWKVPLWNPAAEPAAVYPKPQLSLGLVTNLSEKEVTFPCDLSEPQNVYFYTQTKDPDPDPHKWRPVEGVDYVNAPRPVVQSRDFEDGDPRQYEPNEAVVPPAFGPCTFRLDPSPVLTNLMAARSPKALSAVLETVTLVRSTVLRQAGWEDPAAVEAKVVREVRSTVTEVYRKFLRQLPLDGPPGAQLLEELKAQAAQDATFKELTDKLAEAKGKVNRLRDEVITGLQRLEGEARGRFESFVNNSLKGPLDDLETRVREVSEAAQFNKERALLLLGDFQRAVEEKLLLVSSMPGAAQAHLARYAEMVVSLHGRLVGELERLEADLNAGTAQAADALQRAEAALEQARGLIRAFETIGQQRPAAWLPDPTPKVRASLGCYFFAPVAGDPAGCLGPSARDVFDESAGKLLDALRRATTARAALDALRAYKATPLYAALKSPEKLRQFVKEALNVNADALTFQQIGEAVRFGERWQKATLKKWQEEARKQIALLEVSPNAKRLGEIRDSLSKWLTVPGQGLRNEVKAFGDEVDGRITNVSETIKGALVGAETDIAKAKDELRALLNSLKPDVPEDLKRLEGILTAHRDRVARQADTYLDQAAQFLLNTPAATGARKVFQEADEALRVIRAFGAPPRVPKLEFEREHIGYYYKELESRIDLTPVNAVVDQGAAALERLKPLGVKLPTRQAIEQLIPADLRNFDLSSVFPNFAGLDLRNLFAGIKLSNIGGDNVKVTHGLDEQTRRAFVRADVDFEMNEPATLFSIGPLSLQIPRAQFHATSVVDVDARGATRRKVNGRITGDWQIVISGMVVIKFKNTELFFDDGGGLRFSINPRNIELPGILAFVSEAMKGTGGDEDGLSFGLLPDGFQSILSLPLPDVQAGAFGFANLRLAAVFSLRFGDSFTISLGCGIARKEAPFTVTGFILGGAGSFEVTAIYTPATKKIKCVVDFVLTVAGSVAIALGPIKGGVYVYFGVTARYETGGAGFTVGALLLMRGEVSVLGIVSVCLVQLLEAAYNPANKAIIGRGRVSLKIKICWCFTLKVNKEVSYTLGTKGDRRGEVAAPARRVELASLSPDPALVAAAFEDEFDRHAREYVSILV